jgi:hypothetical protein
MVRCYACGQKRAAALAFFVDMALDFGVSLRFWIFKGWAFPFASCWCFRLSCGGDVLDYAGVWV